MDLFLKLPNVSKAIRKNIKSLKPFWCEELIMLWEQSRNSTKAFKSYKGYLRYSNNLYWNTLVFNSSLTKSWEVDREPIIKVTYWNIWNSDQ